MNPGFSTNGNMKRLKFRIGVVISILLTLLPFGIVWLSAIATNARFYIGTGQ
jgi:heme/copper-type cytochrome/quinol oxidase subunit 4